MKKILYFLSILFIFLINNNVNAVAIDFKSFGVVGYNNNGNSLTYGEQFYCDTNNGNCSMYLTTIANSYGGAWGIQSPIPLLENHIYSISLEMRSPNSGLSLSSKPNISIGNSFDNAKSNYENSYFYTDTIYTNVNNNILQYSIKANANANYFIIPFTTYQNTYSVFYIDKLIIDDLGINPLSQNEINNIMNNQTSIIQNDINNLEDSIKDNFNDCVKNLFPNYIVESGHYNGIDLTINNDLSITLNGSSSTSHFINLAYTDIFDENLPGAFGYCSNNGYCLTNFDGLGYTKFNNVIWLLIHPNRYYDNVKLYPMLTKGSVPSEYVPPGQESCKNKLDSFNDTQKETNNKLDNLNDTITNSDSSGATGEASDFFSNFNTDTFGLTSVITAPLDLIKSVTSKSCTPLKLTLPFVNKELNLPCLSTIYENYFGSFLTIYRTITFGFVSYWVCIKIFNLVKDFKNPEHDEIEVLDL